MKSRYLSFESEHARALADASLPESRASWLIQFDVREFNKLSGKRKVTVTNLADGTVTFSRNNRTVSISTNGNVIKIVAMQGRTQLSDFEVRPEWNEDTVYCDLFIGDEKVSTHRASQKIIGDMLFP